MNAVKNTILTAISFIGSAIATALGGWDSGVKVLIIFMATDYICGLIVAGVFHQSPKSCEGKLESRASLKGLFRKVGILFAVIIATYLDQLLGDNAFARTATIIFFCANEGLSIVENLALMGVPMPKSVINALEQLSADKSDNIEKAQEKEQLEEEINE